MLEGVAGLAAAERRPERSWRLHGAAAARRTGMGSAPPPEWCARVARWAALAHEADTDGPRELAMAEGQTMALEQAVAYGLEDAPAGPGQTTTAA